MVTVRTPQGIATGAGSVALSRGLGGDHRDGTLDDARHLGPRLLHQVRDLGTGLGGVHPVLPHPFQPLGEDMLQQAAKKGGDIHALPRNSISRMGARLGGHLWPILALDPPHRDRRTDDILGHRHGQTLRAGRHIALRHLRHTPVGISLSTWIDQRMALVGLHRLSTPLEGLPLPCLVQQGVGPIASMPPRLSLRIPSPTGGDDGQVRMVLAMAPRGLDDHNGTACACLATDRTTEVIATLHPAWPEGTQPLVRVLRTRFPHHLRHGQHNRTRDDAVMQPLTDVADPLVDRDLPAAQAQRRLTTQGDALVSFPTMATSLCDRAHLFRMTALEHLVHECVIGGRILTMRCLCKPVPVLGNDLVENVPALRGFGMHQAASRWGGGDDLFPGPASRVHPVIRPHWGTLTHQPLPDARRRLGQPKCQFLYDQADIEQVQKEKKPFTLR
jgi:hypothetical protein